MIISAIVLLTCGNAQGTGVLLRDNQIISAQHVTTLSCENVGRVSENPVLDFSHGTHTLPVKATMEYSCEAIVVGQKYRLLGYHNSELKTFEFTATNYIVDVADSGRKQLRGLTGLALPGMSGGPVLNDKGQVVATISTRLVTHNLTLVTELWRTELCSPSEPASS